MNATKKRRFRFGLRTLLILVGLCAAGVAVFNRLPNTVSRAEYFEIRKGMTPEEVRSILGEPCRIERFRAAGRSYEAWWFADSIWSAPKQDMNSWSISFTDGRVDSVLVPP